MREGGRAQQGPDLGDPGLDELPVGASLPEAAAQSGAFDAQQIAQGAQIDHPTDGTDRRSDCSTGFPALRAVNSGTRSPATTDE
jgi:hypothetical protein